MCYFHLSLDITYGDTMSISTYKYNKWIEMARYDFSAGLQSHRVACKWDALYIIYKYVVLSLEPDCRHADGLSMNNQINRCHTSILGLCLSEENNGGGMLAYFWAALTVRHREESEEFHLLMNTTLLNVHMHFIHSL